MANTPALYRAVPFGPVADFEHMGQMVDVPMTLLGKPALPPSDLKELMPYFRGNKDKLSLANAGVGSASHMCCFLFLSASGLDLKTVPYTRTAAAMNDLLGGQFEPLCDKTTQTTPYIKSCCVKAYGATLWTRLEALRDLPTLAEAGLPGFQVVEWHSVNAPKGIPKPVLDTLVAAL